MDISITKYLIIFFLSLPLSFNAHSQDKIDAQIHNISPWCYINNKTNTLDGIYIDTLKELQKRSGLMFDMSAVPLKRVTHNLSNGKTDFSMLFERKDFKDVVINLGAVMKMNVYLVRKKGESDFRRLSITRGENEIADKLIHSLKLKNIDKNYTNNHITNIKMLQNDRADAAILVGDDLLFDLHTKLPGFICEIIEVKSAFAFMHKKSNFNQPEIINKITTTLDGMWKDGFIKRNNDRVLNNKPKCLVKNTIEH